MAARSYVASDASIITRYGTAARDTSDQPVETFFDTIADVQAIADARLTLLKADRRKFEIAVAGIVGFTGALDYSQVAPAVTVIDDEKGASLPCAITGIVALDYETERSTLTCWG